MSGGVTQFLQLLGGLSLLISLHEFGHFFFARLFKTRVEKFYLFFDFLFPVSTLLNFAIFKKKIGETEYGLGWFPLGGYVKISGMVDESMDKEALALPPQPWEYRSKKAYQRLFIMLGGIIMNVLVAIVLYVIIFGVWGEHYLPMKNVKYGIAVDSVGHSIGLNNGDMIRTIDDEPIERFEGIPIALIFHKDNGTIGITRNGRDTTINIPFGTIGKMIKAKGSSMIGLRIPAHIDSVFPNTIAEKIALKAGDSIIAINGKPVQFRDEVMDVMTSTYGQPMSISLVRDSRIDTITVTVPKDSSLGILFGPGERYYAFVDKKYTPLQAIPRGFSYTWGRLRLYVAQFKLMRSKEVKASDSMGGFYSMGKLYPPDFNWHDFLMLTAFISVALAFMNLLPIPGLDGGYVIFLLFEMISGRKVSDKVMERATTIGFLIIVGLMVYVNGLDILRIFKK